MNSIDEYDIRQAFAALDCARHDDSPTGRLAYDDVWTLYLGLGFASTAPATRRRLTVQQLQEDAEAMQDTNPDYHPDTSIDDHSLSLEETLKLFQKYAPREQSRSRTLQAAFDDLKSQEKDVITAADLVQASRTMADAHGMHDIDFSHDYAVHMMALANHKLNIANQNQNNNNMNEASSSPRVRRKEFFQLFAPPEP